MAIDMSAMRHRRVGVGFHANDALSLSDFERAGVFFFGLLGGDGLGLLGGYEFVFGGGVFFGEVEFFW